MRPWLPIAIAAITTALATSCGDAEFRIVDQTSRELVARNLDFQIEVTCMVYNSGSSSGVAKVAASLEQVGIDEWTRTATGMIPVRETRSFTMLFSEPLYWLASEPHKFACSLQ